MPVYQDAVVFLGTAITLAFALVLVSVRLLLWRRDVRRRLGVLVARASGDWEPGLALEELLARLELAVDRAPPAPSGIGQLTRDDTPVAPITPIKADPVPVPAAVPEPEPSKPAPAAATPPPDALAHADRLRLTLGELPVGIVVCDEHGKVVYRNPTAARQLWRRPSTGRPEPELAGGLSGVLAEALAGRRVSRTIELPGTAFRGLRLTSLPLDNGARIGAVVVVEDLVEERRETAARRDLFADLGRELVEPMVAMSVLADGLASEEDPTIRRRLADRARSESTRARRLVEDLAELGRIAAQEAAHAETVRLSPVTAAAAENVAALAQQRLVQLRFHDEPADAAVLGDRRQVELSVNKLFEHAVDTARAGAVLDVRVTVGAPARELGAAGDMLEIEIVDDVPSNAATRAAGLSFALVEQAARNLGGNASYVATSEATTSRLSLPAVGVAVAAAGARLTPVPDGQEDDAATAA